MICCCLWCCCLLHCFYCCLSVAGAKRQNTVQINDFCSIDFQMKLARSPMSQGVWGGQRSAQERLKLHSTFIYSPWPSYNYFIYTHIEMNLNADIKQAVFNMHSVTYACTYTTVRIWLCMCENHSFCAHFFNIHKLENKLFFLMYNVWIMGNRKC